MQGTTQARRIPAPFATAALGLCFSYLFPSLIGPIAGTLIGFGAGVVILYVAALSKIKTAEANKKPAPHLIVCPTCETNIVISDDQAVKVATVYERISDR